MGAVQINLNDGFAEIKYQSDGETKNKLIDIDDLHSVFKDNVDMDTGDLGVWGDNAIGIKRVISRGDKHWVLVDAVNPCVDVNYHTSSGSENLYKDVYFPSLMMALHLTKSGAKYSVEKKKSFLLCHHNMLLTNKDQLYKFPFGNVYKDGMGRVCWGDVPVPRLENFSQAIGVLQMFLTGTMNSDLYSGSRLIGEGSWSDKLGTSSGSLRTKLKYLQKSSSVKSFPYESSSMVKKVTWENVVQYCKENL